MHLRGFCKIRILKRDSRGDLLHHEKQLLFCLYKVAIGYGKYSYYNWINFRHVLLMYVMFDQNHSFNVQHVFVQLLLHFILFDYSSPVRLFYIMIPFYERLN